MNFKFIIISRTHLVNKSLYLPPVPVVGRGTERERDARVHVSLRIYDDTVLLAVLTGYLSLSTIRSAANMLLDKINNT